MPDATAEELLRLNGRLLESIDQADWNTYQELSDPGLTAFEPEALGQLVDGLEFHRYYFFTRGAGSRSSQNTTMCGPRVRVMGDAAVITYVRLTQRLGADGLPLTIGSAETRVWQRQGGQWKHVHFHRSAVHA
jgi:Calcium/calmodulin dependent protein kinase II association domain